MLLELKNIVKSYPRRTGIFRKEAVSVLKGVSLFIGEGECLGIIGESGSGKSTLSRIILGLETPDGGDILYGNRRERALFQNEMSVVFQDYATSVNPRFRVKNVIAEPLIRMNIPFQDFKERTISLLRQVGLDESFLGRYPHELSGGQLQRICIARALATTPRLLVLDEAVSSLDASVQIQVLDLLKQLKKEHGLSYLFMTHDLMTISYICDRVLFFKEGQIVEEVSEITGLADVCHPYSKKLLLHA